MTGSAEARTTPLVGERGRETLQDIVDTDDLDNIDLEHLSEDDIRVLKEALAGKSRLRGYHVVIAVLACFVTLLMGSIGGFFVGKYLPRDPVLKDGKENANPNAHNPSANPLQNPRAAAA